MKQVFESDQKDEQHKALQKISSMDFAKVVKEACDAEQVYLKQQHQNVTSLEKINKQPALPQSKKSNIPVTYKKIKPSADVDKSVGQPCQTQHFDQKQHHQVENPVTISGDIVSNFEKVLAKVEVDKQSLKSNKKLATKETLMPIESKSKDCDPKQPVATISGDTVSNPEKVFANEVVKQSWKSNKKWATKETLMPIESKDDDPKEQETVKQPVATSSRTIRRVVLPKKLSSKAKSISSKSTLPEYNILLLGETGISNKQWPTYI